MLKMQAELHHLTMIHPVTVTCSHNLDMSKISTSITTLITPGYEQIGSETPPPLSLSRLSCFYDQNVEVQYNKA